MNDTRIVTLTMNPALDTSSTVNRLVPDKKLRCEEPRYEAGGGGINVARVVVRLGGQATAVFVAGGWSGERLVQLLDQENVPNRRITNSQEARENFMVIETETGNQFRFVMPGPELDHGSNERVLAALAELDPLPQFLVVSGSLPPGAPDDFYSRVVVQARERGTRTIVDSNGESLRRAMEAHPFLIDLSRDELEELSGRELKSDEDVETSARRFVREGMCEVCLVSLGSDGALWISADGMHRVRAPKVHAQSKVGAGDSMIAGIVLALSRGWTERQALAYGVAAGAAAAMTPGTELCRPADVERLYQELMNENKEAGHDER